MSDWDGFDGVIGESWRESTPWWPPQPQPPEGAPNVLAIVLDDVGFAQLGCYGSDIDTPNLDQLAADGVRLANFHTTALCSPTRSCLLTGRNHHSNGMARVADLALGYPGYHGRIPKRNGFMSEILAAFGYVPMAVGKWHLTPDDETHMAAPRDTWPTGRGFQRWYGFHGGETHQFVPALYQDNHSVPPPAHYDDGYHLSADLADHAIRYLADLRAVDADQRFLLWFATGACHSPHHAPREWIERYAGHFDGGWDEWRVKTHRRQLEMGIIPPGTELSPSPHWVPEWDSLKAEDQKVAARFMECFAGFLSYTDMHIGRVLDFIEHELGELDDTLVFCVSDNGASSEGGASGSINDARLWNGMPAGRRELRERIDELGTPTAHNNYPWGWTLAGNTPFKRWKREVHEGGIADPCILRLPSRIGPAGSIRHQFAHAIDVLPTILEIIGVESPQTIVDVPQTPIEGTSFAYLLGADSADAAEQHTTQYFEMLGCRGIYHDGFKAVAFKPPGQMYDDGINPNAPFSDDVWELYDKRNDFSECHDLAQERPELLAEMIERWWVEARRYQVLPLDNRPLAPLLNPKPNKAKDRLRYDYRPFGAPVPEHNAPNVRNRTHTITADVVVPDGIIGEGVLLALGSVLGGFTLYLLDGKLTYVHNLVGKDITRITSDVVVAPGAHQLRFHFASNDDFTGTATLALDGTEIGRGDIPMFTPAAFSATGSGLTCGYEIGPAVSPDYAAPFGCTVELLRVVVELSGEPYRDLMAEFVAIMSEQ